MNRLSDDDIQNSKAMINKQIKVSTDNCIIINEYLKRRKIRD